MDGQDYGFQIQEEELDLLGDSVYTEVPNNVTVVPPVQETSTAATAPTEGVTPLEEENIDPLAILAEDEPVPEKEGEEENEEVEISTEDDTFEKLASNLVQLGIFTLDEGEETISTKKPEEFAERWVVEKQKGANQILNQVVGQYGPEYADAWQKIFIQGLNPYEYFERVQNIESLEDLDLSQESAQEKVVRIALQRQGLSPERVDTKVQKLKDLGELEEESKDYHEFLLNAERTTLQQRAKQEESRRQYEEQQKVEYGQAISSVLNEKLKEKEYDGIPVTPKVAQNTFDFLYTPRYQLPTGEVITGMEKFWIELNDPKNHALAVKVALLAQDNFDTSKIQKRGVSKETNKLFADLTKKNKQEARTTPTKSEKTGNSFFD